MKLLRNYMKTSIKKAKKNNMKIRVIGDLKALEVDLQESISKLIDATKEHTGLNFTIAINYGSRDEMIRGIREISKDCVSGRVVPEEIDEKIFSGSINFRNFGRSKIIGSLVRDGNFQIVF